MDPQDSQDSRVLRLCAVMVLAWSLGGLLPLDGAATSAPVAAATPTPTR